MQKVLPSAPCRRTVDPAENRLGRRPPTAFSKPCLATIAKCLIEEEMKGLRWWSATKGSRVACSGACGPVPARASFPASKEEGPDALARAEKGSAREGKVGPRGGVVARVVVGHVRPCCRRRRKTSVGIVFGGLLIPLFEHAGGGMHAVVLRRYVVCGSVGGGQGTKSQQASIPCLQEASTWVAVTLTVRSIRSESTTPRCACHPLRGASS